LSFDAVLDGVHLVTDSGCYLYTASVEERNNFRSTAYHNTPRVDAEEINRLIDPLLLWNLRNDAKPEVRDWQPGAERDVLCIAHSGYQRLAQPVTPVRTLALDHGRHSLQVTDEFVGSGSHSIEIPFHLAPGVAARLEAEGAIAINTAVGEFRMEWQSTSEWQVELRPARMAPSYGVVRTNVAVVLRHAGALPGALRVTLVQARAPWHGR
jgi:hypothetical protein